LAGPVTVEQRNPDWSRNVQDASQDWILPDELRNQRTRRAAIDEGPWQWRWDIRNEEDGSEYAIFASQCGALINQSLLSQHDDLCSQAMTKQYIRSKSQLWKLIERGQ
jgi:hypothetical protein